MLSNRLSCLRKKYKFNQTEMAKKLGMGRTTYAMYEQGNRSFDFNKLTQIANFFEVTTDYLLGRKDYPEDSMNTRNYPFIKQDERLLKQNEQPYNPMPNEDQTL
ncbi:helix-turn-helix domain-containing protein [uncultured Marinococcus sp.]|uniref:helix-turn-helix domain-containing protein n=1 Tax=uncultured Marinococcus sp. TaxID=487012 RepID=UPI0026251578|nr:helix-turn-helix transcriptional regulator [uncultured Marinococcus sp.]